jgi:hypothetical protein
LRAHLFGGIEGGAGLSPTILRVRYCGQTRRADDWLGTAAHVPPL